MAKMMDDLGNPYYESLPEEYGQATIDDFHLNGQKKVGMEFLILGFHWVVYQVMVVTEFLSAADIKPFIDAQRVYIKKQPADSSLL